jgi:protein involved in polysaccharide export with SLBB domain
LGLGAEALPASETNPAAETTSPALVASNQFLSVQLSNQRAAWQERLTLGPGDVLNVRLFGSPELGSREIVVAPDGRISYLQAHHMMASGLTVDELRQRIEQGLSRFYREPRVIISPVAFHSKKYVVLGAVIEKGVFTLNRPLTIIEAVARARGLGAGASSSRKGSEDADFSRSFLMRGGKQMPIDFERLFGEGDLTQNVALEPNDYLYFAPAARNEVYVLGEVVSPGVVDFNPRSTLISTITAQGGFSPAAWRKKVLVVRGSLARPETFVLNTTDILKGKAPDFRLQRKDIVYVSKSPWHYVGQVVNLAVSAYLSGVAVTWTGETVTPAIGTKPYIPTP